LTAGKWMVTAYVSFHSQATTSGPNYLQFCIATAVGGMAQFPDNGNQCIHDYLVISTTPATQNFYKTFTTVVDAGTSGLQMYLNVNVASGASSFVFPTTNIGGTPEGMTGLRCVKLSD
jgi:hypothetical protein